ncbi:LuxR C-terminal-related transcriptional regulator [Nitrobacter sp. 62-13]|uniref:LuxR C-terminal-related transcriptional regulator n=1 Tax=Nitrobacter sp. 62-13 TaxID=1895797 RepID=UPI000A883E65|nr:LuxR C-terminal-related transcriptional regulator [Nitrobacter sp. 62-13]
MSASNRNHFHNVPLSNHFISLDAHKDQSVRTMAAPAPVIYPHPPLASRPQLNVGSASCGASPPQSQACPQHSIRPSKLTDVAPPWQAPAKSRSAVLSSISIPDEPDSNQDGHNAPRSKGTDDSFSGETKITGNIIVIIDNRALVRDCLAHCLQAAYVGYQVFAFATLTDWMKVHDDFPVPSVILLYIQARQKASDDSDGVENLARAALSAPLIIISDVEDGSRIMSAIESGARGYIPTSMTLGIAVEAVRLVEAGGTFVPISVVSSFQNASNGESQLFTARQIMVVEALCRGKANKQIAYELGMCESTVKVHIRHIMRKLKARNRTEVAIMASSLFDKSADQKSASNT